MVLRFCSFAPIRIYLHFVHYVTAAFNALCFFTTPVFLISQFSDDDDDDEGGKRPPTFFEDAIEQLDDTEPNDSISAGGDQ